MTASIKGALSLALIAAVCTALVSLTYYLTEDRIAENQQAHLESNLAPALAGVFYDNKLMESVVTLLPPHGLPGNDRAVIYRVYSGDEAVAALFAVTARDGYSGPIRILIGVDFDGTVSGVRILEHRETPGIGDVIHQDKSDWTAQFAGRSLGAPPTGKWAIRNDGGVFDQLTGASVTPRAVIRAIRDTLLYYQEHRDRIFGMPQGLQQEVFSDDE